MTQILSHGNEVSGTTIFGDGTKVYWTEGRGSDIVVRHPHGKIETIETWNLEQTPEQQAILREEQRIEEEGADVNRTMTPGEEREWENTYHRTPGAFDFQWVDGLISEVDNDGDPVKVVVMLVPAVERRVDCYEPRVYKVRDKVHTLIAKSETTIDGEYTEVER